PGPAGAPRGPPRPPGGSGRWPPGAAAGPRSGPRRWPASGRCTAGPAGAPFSQPASVSCLALSLVKPMKDREVDRGEFFSPGKRSAGRPRAGTYRLKVIRINLLCRRDRGRPVPPFGGRLPQGATNDVQNTGSGLGSPAGRGPEGGQARSPGGGLPGAAGVG